MTKEETEEVETSPSIWERRVPQIVGLYLAGAYTVFEMSQWVVKRYSLHAVYEDLCVFGLLSFLPTVCLLAWGHGAPGRDRWTRTELIVLPANLLLSVSIVLLLLRGAGDGSENASRVAAENKVAERTEGLDTSAEVREAEEKREAEKKASQKASQELDELAASVPTLPTHRTRLVGFPFENQGQEEGDWAMDAINLALEIDLDQEVRIEFAGSVASSGIAETLLGAGYQGGTVPLGLMRQGAQKADVQYFLSGSFRFQEGEEGGLVIEAKVFDTERGKVVHSHRIESDEFFAAVDELAVALRKDFGVSDRELEETVDLPVAEQASSNLEAFRAAVRAQHALHFAKNKTKAIAELNRAVELDPTFAFAYLQKAVLIQMGNEKEFTEALQAAQQHSYRLSEMSRLALRVMQLWLVDKNHKEALRAVDEWLVRRPEDVRGLLMSITIRQQINDREGAIAGLEKLEKIEWEYVYVDYHAQLLMREGRIEEAQEKYRSLVKKVPTKVEGFLGIARASQLLGQHRVALEALKDAIALEPNNPKVLLAMADQLGREGKLESALETYERASQRSTTNSQKRQAGYFLAGHLWLRGQRRKAIELIEGMMKTLVKELSAPELAMIRLQDAWRFAAIGEVERAQEVVREAREHKLHEGESIHALQFHAAMAHILIEEGDDDGAMESVSVAGQIASTFGFPSEMLGAVLARVLENDSPKLAETMYEAFLENEPSATAIRLALAKHLLTMERYQDARDNADEVLRVVPSQPEAHLVAAKALLKEAGAAELAGDIAFHLRSAIKFWRDADEDFEPLVEAQELLAVLKSDGVITKR